MVLYVFGTHCFYGPAVWFLISVYQSICPVYSGIISIFYLDRVVLEYATGLLGVVSGIQQWYYCLLLEYSTAMAEHCCTKYPHPKHARDLWGVIVAVDLLRNTEPLRISNANSSTYSPKHSHINSTHIWNTVQSWASNVSLEQIVMICMQ
jgi:hypothetical protein